MGKMIDMEALASKNQKVRAVSNMSVNSRGDTIDNKGNIIKSVNEKVNEHYAKTVGNRSAQVSNQPKQSAAPQKPKVDHSELNLLEQEIENNLDEELEIEQIKASEKK